MILRQNNTNGAIFSGKGDIFQNADGTLSFRIFVVEYQNIDPHRYFQGGRRKFELFAYSYDGREWTASEITPSVHWDASSPSDVFINGTLSALISNEPSSSDQYYMRLHFFEKCDVPLNSYSRVFEHGSEYMVLDRAKFNVRNLGFELKAHDDETVIEIHSESEFPPNFHLRIQEALQFLIARSVFWRALKTVKKTEARLELWTPIVKASSTSLRPPISSAHAEEYHGYGWNFFGKFLDYVAKETKNTYWNPLAYQLYNACQSSANSIDARALGYCVAVEALTNLSNVKQDPEKADQIADCQKRLREWLSENDLVGLKPRLDGLVGMLGDRRVRDDLCTLAAAGRIEKKYIAPWSYLRNRQTHPRIRDLKKPSKQNYDKLIISTEQVQVLLYQLIFHLIDYSGPFSDYGDSGFSSKHYPLPYD